jgi:hypothetical protein
MAAAALASGAAKGVLGRLVDVSNA